MTKQLLTCVGAVLLAVATAAAEPELVRVQPLPKAEAPPTSEIIDLFGHQPGAVADRATLPDAEREIRRPDSPTLRAPGSPAESRVIDRRSRASTGWSWMDVLPLAAVLGLIALVAMVIRRFLPSRGLIGQSGGLLDVVARTPVSPKQSVLLVRMGRRFLLLGVSPDRIATLCVVEDVEGVAELLGEVESRRTDSSTTAFQSSFKVEEAEFEEDIDPDAPASVSGVRGLLEKVRQMKRSRVA